MISQTADYALRAVVAMALRRDQSLTARELSDVTGVPAPYLAKVLRALTHAGLARSHRGTGGGFSLALPLEGVTLLDVVNAVAPRRWTHGCLSGRPAPTCGLCGLHRRIEAGLALAEAHFAGLTMAELIGDEQGEPPLCAPGVPGPRPAP